MIKLRDYQVDASKAGVSYLQSHKSPSIICGATACGKSIIIADIVSKINEPTLILQPSIELLKQNYCKSQLYNLPSTIYSSSLNKKDLSNIIYATIGSIKNRVYALKSIGIKHIIIDEAHLWTRDGGQFIQLADELGIKSILGLTATPYYLTSNGETSEIKMMTDVSIFKDIIYDISIQKMVNDRYWSNLEYDLHGFDESLLKINSRSGDYTEVSLQKASEKNSIPKQIIAQVEKRKKEGKKRILIFADSIKTAENIAYHIPYAKCVSTYLSKQERKEIINDFNKEDNDTKVIVNYNILGTGFDCPKIDSIMIGRKTLSLANLYQWIGRGTRIHKDKECCVIDDYCNNIKSFGKIETIALKRDMCFSLEINKPKASWSLDINDRKISDTILNESMYGEKLIKYVRPTKTIEECLKEVGYDNKNIEDLSDGALYSLYKTFNSKYCDKKELIDYICKKLNLPKRFKNG